MIDVADIPKEFRCLKCKGQIEQEDREEQFGRIVKGIRDLFPYETVERSTQLSRNLIGFGPNFMYKCKSCGSLRKIVPTGKYEE